MINIISYIALTIIIIFIFLKLYEYYYVNKMKKTVIKYHNVDIEQIKKEKIKYILYFKHNIRSVLTKHIIGEMISHSAGILITNMGNSYLISNDASVNNVINIYSLKTKKIDEIFTFNNTTYKLKEIIEIKNDINAVDFIDKIKYNINHFDYDITGYNCHMLFLDTFANFEIKVKQKNITGFLPSLNQIILDLISLDSHIR